MDIQTFINQWLAVSNAFDTDKYLTFYQPDVILDDLSVGEKFRGHSGIRQYFEDYFIGYQTHTLLVNLKIIDVDSVHLEVEFTGTFTGGRLGGIFDLTFRDGRIASAKADLLH